MTDEADLLAPFCEAASISAARDLAGTVKKRIIVSLCFANAENLHNALFPDQHMDWNGVHEYLERENAAYTIFDWMILLRTIDFVNEPAPRAIVAELVASALASIKVSTQGKNLSPLESLQLCFAKASMAPAWDVLCKTLMLSNLIETDHAAAIQHFLQDVHQYSSQVVDTLIKGLSSCKHAPEEYTATYFFLFSQCCHVRTHVLQAALDARLHRAENVKITAQSIYHAHRKPSLSFLLEQKRSKDKDETERDVFQHFCNACRLASNANLQIKRFIYYLKVIDAPAQAMRRLLAGKHHTDMAVLEAVTAAPNIVIPDMDALRAFIREIQHTGPPSQTLRLFKERCIPGSNTWAIVLRLYLAAYCKPAAKELWRYALSLSRSAGGAALCTSTETELTTQRFVAQEPIETEFITDMLLSEETGQGRTNP
jgi:hypothetical protein